MQVASSALISVFMALQSCHQKHVRILGPNLEPRVEHSWCWCISYIEIVTLLGRQTESDVCQGLHKQIVRQQ